MKTIDEAIAHAREVAENNRKESNYDAFSLDYMNEMHKKNCVKCAEEHEQLAEWLEELKEARKGFEENRKAGYKHGYSYGYAKAIDEFAERLKYEHKQTITTESVYISRSFDEVVDEIAEEMRGAE